MSDTVISVNNLGFAYDGETILSGVNFSVEAGDFLSIVGPNGAGKSTLLKCLNGILSHSSGSISLNGKELQNYSVKGIAQRISYVPQGTYTSNPFSVHEFILMGRYPYLSPFSTVGKKDKEAVERAVEMSGVAKFLDRSISTLSGGERQKVYLGAAIAQEGKIMLLDEPGTFLDPKHQCEVMDILTRLNKNEGTTIVTVTHDINSALLFSNRIIGLKRGEIVFDGFPADLAADKTPESIFDIPFISLKHPVTGKPLLIAESQK